MQIWYLNHYAGSSISPKEGRSYFLARGILNAGSKCSVISSSFHHLQRVDQPEQQEKILKKNVDGIPFIWLKTPKYQGNGLSRVLNMMSYALSCWKNDFVKLSLLEKPDTIVVTSVHPFHILAGLKWAKRYNAKLVFEVRDLWPLSLNLLLGVSKWHPLSLLLSVFEKIGYKKADLITSVLPNALDYMQPRGVEPSRFIHLPNGYIDDYPWSETNIHAEELAKIRGRYPRVIMHTGSMGKPNGLEMLVCAANNLKGNADVAFVFIGDGALKKELIELSNSPHIYHFDPIPKEQVMSALSFSDICYCGAQDLKELYKYGISPNKVFDYMTAKKFVLLGIDSPNNPVELSDAGCCFSPSQENELPTIIQTIIKFDDSVIVDKGLNGYEFLKKEHNFNNLAVKLLTKLNSL